MRTARKDPLTRTRLLDSAQELMLAKGYSATSVDEVCEAAGLTKGSFFHYFAGKEQLGKLVAEHFFNARKQLFLSASFRQKPDPRDRILGYIDFLIDLSKDARATKGCLLGTFVQELSVTHPEIRAVCEACLNEQAEFLRQHLEQAKAKYAPRARWSPQSLADHLVAVVQGAIVLAKARQDRTLIEGSLRHVRQYVQCLLGD